MVAFVRSLQAGDFSQARRQHYALMPLFEAAFLETNPMPIKEMMQQRGKPSGGCRLPLCSVRPDTRKKIELVLQQCSME
jgi:4-hydroxy-tetrahydrodipicolinate synthase